MLCVPGLFVCLLACLLVRWLAGQGGEEQASNPKAVGPTWRWAISQAFLLSFFFFFLLFGGYALIPLVLVLFLDREEKRVATVTAAK